MTILTHHFLQSSAISSCTYDTEKKELSITFLTGRTYIYEDVDQSIYDSLTETKSAGKYFASIKNGLKLK